MKKAFLSTAVIALAGLMGHTAQAEMSTYTVEPTHTFVNFEAQHFGTSTLRGRFDKKDGKVQIDREAKSGKAEISIDMNSISTGVGPLDAHLKKKDFLDAGAFPSAKFVSDKFSFDGDKVKEVAGSLTFLGKTQPITIKALNFNCYTNPYFKREVCGGDFETTLVRSNYGMTFGLPGIPDNIRLLIQIEAVKQ
jgi:polyisoprenoid-binding protein YceI